jgi:hypothetical protein
MRSCEQVSKLASKSKEEKLNMRERIGLAFHGMMCRACRNFMKNNDKLSDMLKAYGNRTEEISPPKEDK